MDINLILNKAKTEAKKYQSLETFIDWASIRKQLQKNPAIIFIDRNKYQPLNLIEALLRQRYSYSTVFDYKSNLRLLDYSLSETSRFLKPKDRKSVSLKICNLSNTGFWDTAAELWLAKELISNDELIELDYPLGKKHRGYNPPDADIAIIDVNSKAVWLVDCVCPTLKDKKYQDLMLVDEPNPHLNSIKAINWILFNLKKKFNNKFAPNLDQFPYTRIAIFISVIKADDISIHLSDRLTIPKLPVKITNPSLRIHPRLDYGIAVRFQDNNGELEYVSLLVLDNRAVRPAREADGGE